MRRLILAILTATLTLSITPTHANVTITSITDGDTIKLSDGTSVRLLQIDSPELRGNECYSTEAQKALAKLINRSGKIALTTDPNLDEVDRYGRLLRYLFADTNHISIAANAVSIPKNLSKPPNPPALTLAAFGAPVPMQS